MKIVSIVGARPQFVKAAVLSRKMRELTDWKQVMVHTGQHFDENMSEAFFREMQLPTPDHYLDIHSLPHGAMTGRMLEKVESLLQDERPDLVLVYGDTNSTLAGALAAKKLFIPVAHVEAGLRSFDERMPEEVNRVLTDRLSDLLFIPSQNASRNLEREGVDPQRVYEVGDIMHDAVKFYSQQSAEQPGDLPENFLLLTLHRQENTDDPVVLGDLVNAINELSKEIDVVLPLHPRTRSRLAQFDLHLNARIIEPVGYLPMLKLLKDCRMVLTDSGGLQKEAFYLRKFCITLRTTTEWTELLDLGVNRLCGSNQKKILEAFAHFKDQKFVVDQQPYGEGNTADRIIEVLRSTATAS